MESVYYLFFLSSFSWYRNTKIEHLDPRTSRTSESVSSLLNVENRYRPSSLSELDRSSTFIIPGIIQETVSQTESSTSVIKTVEVSAVTEWKHPKRARPKRPKQMEKPSGIELADTDSALSSNEVDNSKTRTSASENVAQTQTNTEKQPRRDRGNSRPCFHSQRTTRSSKIYPEQIASGNIFCTQSVAWPEQRHKGHGCSDRQATAGDSSFRDDRNVRTQQSTDAPKKVAFNLPAKSASEQETAVAMDEDSFSRISSSHLRSSPGLESMSRVFSSQSMRDSDSESECWCSVLKKLQWLSLAYFARGYYGVWLQKMPFKVNQLYSYRGILVNNIYLINISNSVFDGATNKSVLNIERSLYD